MSTEPIYKLRCNLLGHSMDVRAVATGNSAEGKEFIVSSSRDRSSKVWFPTEDGNFGLYQSCEGHTSYVSCATILQPTPKHPKGLILTGGHDHTILAFEIGKETPVFRLISHKATVCSISALNDTIISGSWDSTAKVWLGEENVATLVGHEAAVWAVALFTDGMRILTASADRDIRLWINNETKTVFKGHTDCVRALALVDENRFLSGSNDATIRLWNVNDGETLNIFYGHTNFIYSIAVLSNKKGFASVGEDRTLRVWDDKDCTQVIHLPATSVWSVASTADSDIVTGSSDGVVRVFTSDPNKYADSDLLALFEKEVGQSTIAAQQELGGMKVSELPGPEALLPPGKKDGDTKMIRENGQVACYSWSAAEQKWSKIGDVVGASGATQSTSGKVLYEGKEYDYVFSVELDDKTTCKLPFNITEDPWFAAQKFIDKNNLSQLFLDQVANFIMTNTKGMQLGGPSTSDYVDPFTGGSRYVPGSSSGTGMNGSGGGGGLDPFTGSGAYRTGQSQASATAPPTTGTLQDRVRAKLNAEGIKLWTAPYYDESKGVVDDNEVLSLSVRYCKDFNVTEMDIIEILLALQQKALDKLAERELFKATGLATLIINFDGFQLPTNSSSSQPNKSTKIQIKLNDINGRELKGKVAELIAIDENQLKLTTSSGNLVDDNLSLESQNIKNSGQITARPA